MTAPERLRALAEWCERHGVTDKKHIVRIGIGPYSVEAHVSQFMGSQLLAGRESVSVDESGWVNEIVDGVQVSFHMKRADYPKTVDFPALEQTS